MDNNSLTRSAISTPSLPLIDTSPAKAQAWLAHAAQQRRQLSISSFSSVTSSPSALFSPELNMTQSPAPLVFGESEHIKDDKDDNDDQEPELILNVRPSQLRASLMARAKQSAAKIQQKRSESMPVESGSRLSGQSDESYNSLSSAFDSRPSARSSISSSISGWAPRARSTSVSSQGSNDSVNLDALIAEGSDINEECPLELEDGDDVEWSKDQQRQLQLQGQIATTNLPGPRSKSATGISEVNVRPKNENHAYWSDSEMLTSEGEEELDGMSRRFSQIAMDSSLPVVRGLSMGPAGGRTTVKSPRFPDGRNPFDLEADYADTPAGLRTSDRMSNVSNYSSTSSNRSSIGRLPASGLKAPSPRLVQPATRSMLAQPKATASTKTGIARPSGLQAPRTGLQAPRSGLQAPRAASSSTRGSSIGAPGRTNPSTRTSPAMQQKGVATSRLPSNPTSTVRPGTKSQIAPPSSVRKLTQAGSAVAGSNRPRSLIQAPSTSRIASTATARSPPGASKLSSPKRTSTAPNLVTSPTRVGSSAYLTSPTSSHSSTSSTTRGSSARDTITPLSMRLSNATGTSHLAQPKTTASRRSISMYGSNNLYANQDSVQYQDYEEDEYAVLTPPQSPSSKYGSGLASGRPRSFTVGQSRLVAPAVSTSKTSRVVSPSPLSAGSNSGGQGSFLPRPHTPSSSHSRIPSGLVSPRAGRY
ncbi:hypothetical protein BGZ46_000013 [Entomortierella lignicola]|nr:hypothetical protein BGZ46_000013 [Entomortierella lignicola]